jgi:predicted MPP superfamily phosphohydrolase
MLAAPTGIYAAEIEPEDIQVARVDVRIPGLPRGADGMLIGHLSDTHCDSPRAVQRTSRAARLLRSQNPDVVFVTGDYITHKAHERMPAAANALRTLADAPLGAIAVLGNHDWWSGDPDFVAGQMRRVGFKVLRNRSVFLASRNLWVVGLEQRCDDLQDPDIALQGVPKDAIKLLLIHEPDYADEAPNGFALQFSGHSHGGQVRIPGLPPIHVPTYGRRYPEGLQQAKNHLVYTTRGVGMIGPKVRLFCPPEVAVIRLVRT